MDPLRAGPYADRADAGNVLGERVAAYLRDMRVTERALVLGMPRGGMVVAAVVAQAIDADLDLVGVSKIGFPGEPEYGIGAVAEHGPPVFSANGVREAGLTEQQLAEAVAREHAEVQRRVAQYRQDRPEPQVADRIVIVVDDGLATGVSARAALASVRRQGPRHLMFAAPVCARDSAAMLADADAVVCARTEDDFESVGAYYGDFTQTTDRDVREILTRAWAAGREAVR